MHMYTHRHVCVCVCVCVCVHNHRKKIGKIHKHTENELQMSFILFPFRNFWTFYNALKLVSL